MTWFDAFNQLDKVLASANTARNYRYWLTRFQQFTLKSVAEVTLEDSHRYFISLAEEGFTPSSQRQAHAALRIFFTKILGIDFDLKGTRVPIKVAPVILSQDEAHKIFSELKQPDLLAAQLLYDCGLRLCECIILRLASIDLDKAKINIFCDHGFERSVPLPSSTFSALKLPTSTVWK